MSIDNKKKILIVFTGAMELGGIESSLIGLLDSLDYNRVDVDLFIFGHHGALFPMVNRNVSLLPEINELAYLQESFKTKLQHKCYYAAWLRLLTEVKGKFITIDIDDFLAKIVHRCVPKLKKHYDLALSFSYPYELIVDKAEADTKIGWIHTDYSAIKFDAHKLEKKFESLDYIAAVSEDCKNTFCRVFPRLKNKLFVMENILPEDLIRRRAMEFSAIDELGQDKAIRLLSIGRFDYAKNFDNIPRICKGLLEQGLMIKWYIIGFGPGEPLIRDKIAEAEMEDYVIVLGKKENPYPYIKACDLYVQPSRYEGKSVAVREAQILGKPVVITNYATAKSQLEDGVDGVIVPMELEGCVKGIAALLRDEDRLRRLSDTCRQRDYTNAKEVDKLYQLL